VPPSTIKARFIEPMLLLRTDRLPDDRARWRYEIKWDGFRAVAVKTSGRIHLRSRNDKDFNKKYPAIIKALAGIPDETVIDGEIMPSTNPGAHPLTRYRISGRALLRSSTTYSTSWSWPVWIWRGNR
jgi:ATP-dependent DNA ligase